MYKVYDVSYRAGRNGGNAYVAPINKSGISALLKKDLTRDGAIRNGELEILEVRDTVLLSEIEIVIRQR